MPLKKKVLKIRKGDEEKQMPNYKMLGKKGGVRNNNGPETYYAQVLFFARRGEMKKNTGNIAYNHGPKKPLKTNNSSSKSHRTLGGDPHKSTKIPTATLDKKHKKLGNGGAHGEGSNEKKGFFLPCVVALAGGKAKQRLTGHPLRKGQVSCENGRLLGS